MITIITLHRAAIEEHFVTAIDGTLSKEEKIQMARDWHLDPTEGECDELEFCECDIQTPKSNYLNKNHPNTTASNSQIVFKNTHSSFYINGFGEMMGCRAEATARSWSGDEDSACRRGCPMEEICEAPAGGRLESMILKKRLWQSGQSVYYEALCEVGNRKVKIDIKRDSHDYQSHALALLFDGDKWNQIAAKPYVNLECLSVGAYSKNPPEEPFDKDKNDLIDEVKMILA